MLLRKMLAIASLLMLVAAPGANAKVCLPSSADEAWQAFQAAAPDEEMREAGEEVVAEARQEGTFDTKETIERLDETAFEYDYLFDCATRSYRPEAEVDEEEEEEEEEEPPVTTPLSTPPTSAPATSTPPTSAPPASTRPTTPESPSAASSSTTGPSDPSPSGPSSVTTNRPSAVKGARPGQAGSAPAASTETPAPSATSAETHVDVASAPSASERVQWLPRPTAETAPEKASDSHTQSESGADPLAVALAAGMVLTAGWSVVRSFRRP